MGKYLLWRHNVINRFFSLLSSMNQENFEEVELVEHILGQETVRSIERLLGILQSEPKVLEKIKNLE